MESRREQQTAPKIVIALNHEENREEGKMAMGSRQPYGD